MNLLYNTALVFYYAIIKACSLFNEKARQWTDGRKNWATKLSQKRKYNETWIWFHCSSLGEYEDCREIFFRIKKDNSSRKTLLTFFSPSGFEALKQSELFDLIMYLPFDTKRNAKQFLDILQPRVVFFSRSELWLHFLTEIHKRSIPAFLLSLKIDSKSSFLKWPARIVFANCLSAFKHIFCQNETTGEFLSRYFNISASSITGNTRFDTVYADSLSGRELPQIQKFVGDDFVIVVGSCLQTDEKIILETIRRLDSPSIKWIIVPHEINGKHIDEMVVKNAGRAIRYCNMERLSESHTIVIIDFVGVLKHLYKYAHLAIIGGGFERIGIHNLVEPSVYGVKTTFGPKHKNYQEALDLLGIGGATIHHNTEELVGIISKHLMNPPDDQLKNQIIRYVVNNTGGSKRIIEVIRNQFPGLI